MPLYNDIIRDIVPGNHFPFTVTIALADGESVEIGYLTAKERESHTDAEALFQKSVTTVYVPGQGEIVDDGALTHLAVLRFDLTPDDTVLFRAARLAPYFVDAKVRIVPGPSLNTPYSALIYPQRHITRAG